MTQATDESPNRSLAYFAAFLLSLLFAIAMPTSPGGADFDEYAVMAVAFSEHGTPDIRVTDLQKAKSLFPRQAQQFDAAISAITAGRAEGAPGIVRGPRGSYYAIHFWAYSALAALPLKALAAIDVSAFKAFKLVNAAFILALGLSLRRFFGSWGRALGVVVLFLLCAGAPYYRWGSPECMTAASLLAGLALFVGGAPLRAGVLVGVAGMQNPPLIAFVLFAPLLRLVACYDSRLTAWRNLLQATAPRYIAGVAMTASLLALPVLANLYQFGVPSMIAVVAADPGLMSAVRFSSLFLDPNQGMIVAIPGVVAALVYCWAQPGVGRVRSGLFIFVVAAFISALALPTLATTNWNSGARGVMRYAFWIAMPVLFALVWRLNRMPRLPRMFKVSVTAIQVIAVIGTSHYDYLQFSPAAHGMLRHIPRFYNPEPEIFAERVTHRDAGLDNSKVYIYEWQGRAQKVLYHRGNGRVHEKFCAPGHVLQSPSVDSDRGWRYLTGTPVCGPALNVDDFLAGKTVRLGQGWSHPEKNGGQWDGVWSDGSRSSLTMLPSGSRRPSHLMLLGNYFEGNARTRVIVNGHDHGWQDLSAVTQLEFAPREPGEVQVELEHASPSSPAGDARRIAFFLRQISLH